MMDGHHEGVDDRPEPDQVDVVAAALAAGATYQDAGVLVQRSARTIRRWHLETDLSSRVAQHRREMIGEIAGNLARVAGLATQVLADKVFDSQSSEQLRAALAVLDRTLKYHAVGEIDARVAELEARIAELENSESQS